MSIDFISKVSIVGTTFVGVILLSIRTAPQLAGNKYRNAKTTLGSSALVISLGNAIQLVIGPREYVDLFSAVTLVVAQLQACMFTFLVLTLLQSGYTTARNIAKHLLPTIVFVTIYVASLFFFPVSRIHSLDDYNSAPPLILRTLYALVYAIQILIYIRIFRKEQRLYKEKIENYFADANPYELSWASRLFWQATGVGMAVLLYTVIPNQATTFVIKVAIMILYLLFGISFINFQYGLIRMMPATNTATDPATVLEEKVKSIDETIRNSISNQTLFLRQGVVLADYATALGIPERKLSTYINSIYGQNFKRWVNSQRIEYVKQLIEQEPELNIEQIAERSGFADKSQLSKTFREVAGRSFSEYRNR